MKDELDDDEAGATSSGSIAESTTSYSNPRASRNLAEKQRRDNLNANISTMAVLVPAVAGSSRRMDKISILRLAAAFLRSQYTLGPGPECFLPRQYDFDLEQYIIENLVANAGFFLVVTTSGKIVYVSRYVEHQLGHAQHELLGQSLYSFICPEDCEELQRNLTPDGFQNSTSTISSGAITEDNVNSSEDPVPPITDKNFKPQRRSFNIRMSQKALNKREHGQYECLQISGQLRLADAFTNEGTNSNRTNHKEINTSGNDIVFVGIARLVKKRTITELSLLEATKDEYVTRHLVDGRIIFCDHRISVVAGYMTEEVSGLSAFKFMHKEDVRWTMIALRQMYDRGEGFGSSCYRLLSKTGQFIYLRTHGYLEFDKDTQTVESFVCVNTLVSEKEGMKLVKEMKERFSAVTSDPAKAIFTLAGGSSSPISLPDTQKIDQKATVEDTVQLEDAITYLISDLPSPATTDKRVSPSPLPDNQYYKAAVYSHGLPPAAIQATKIGIQSMDCKSPPDDGHSSNTTKDSERRNSVLKNEALSRTAAMRNDNDAVAIAGTSSTNNCEDIELEMRDLRSENNDIIYEVDDEEPMISSIGETERRVNGSEEIYGNNITAKSNRINIGKTLSPVYSKSSSDIKSLKEKRTTGIPVQPHCKGISEMNNQQKEERRYSKQFGNRDIPCGGEAGGYERIDTRVSSTCHRATITRIQDRILSPKSKNFGKEERKEEDKDRDDNDLNKKTRCFNSRKRSRTGEEFQGITTSKRKTIKHNIISNNYHLNDEDQIDCGVVVGSGGGGGGVNNDRIIYYANPQSDCSSNLGGFMGTSPISSTNDLGSEGESLLNSVTEEEQISPANCISMNNSIEGLINDGSGVIGDVSRLESSIEVYQRFNTTRLLNSVDDNTVQQIHDQQQQQQRQQRQQQQQQQQLDDDEDLQEGLLSPSLVDADPDFMKTIEDLKTVICNGKNIDEANDNEFTASDQAVNEGIRRTQFQLEESIAMRESQLNVLRRDLDNPALQAQRENFTQLQAEHNKQKQMLKSLQQDHLTLQVNVKHNVGV